MVVIEQNLYISLNTLMDNFLKKMREKKGWSMQGLAKKAGTSPQHIDRLEKKTRAFTKAMAINIANALDIKPHLLDPTIIYSHDELEFLGHYRELGEQEKDWVMSFLKSRRSGQKHAENEGCDDTLSIPPPPPPKGSNRQKAGARNAAISAIFLMLLSNTAIASERNAWVEAKKITVKECNHYKDSPAGTVSRKSAIDYHVCASKILHDVVVPEANFPDLVLERDAAYGRLSEKYHDGQISDQELAASSEEIDARYIRQYHERASGLAAAQQEPQRIMEMPPLPDPPAPAPSWALSDRLLDIAKMYSGANNDPVNCYSQRFGAGVQTTCH